MLGRRFACGIFSELKQGPIVFFDGPLPAEMPFADSAGVIAELASEAGNGHALRRDERGTPEIDDAGLQRAAPVIAAGEQGVARGRAHAGGGMRIGKTHALCGEAIDVRRVDFATRGIVATDIAVAEVIGKDHDDIGFVRRHQAQ